MRPNTTPDGAGIRVVSILHKYANAQSILASEEIMAGSKHIVTNSFTDQTVRLIGGQSASQ
jgi:hypothetical protein